MQLYAIICNYILLYLITYNYWQLYQIKKNKIKQNYIFNNDRIGNPSICFSY